MKRRRHEAGFGAASIGQPAPEAIVLGNLGTLHEERGRLEEARGVYEAALDAFQATGNRLNEAIALANLGNLLLDMGHLETAMKHLKNAVNTSQEIAFAGEGAFLGGLAMAYMQNGEMAEARACIDRGNVVVKKLNYKIEEGLFMCRRGLWNLPRAIAKPPQVARGKPSPMIYRMSVVLILKALDKLKLVLAH